MHCLLQPDVVYVFFYYGINLFFSAYAYIFTTKKSSSIFVALRRSTYALVEHWHWGLQAFKQQY